MFKNLFRVLFLSLVLILAGFFVVKAQSLTSIDFVSPVGSITGSQYTGNAATASALLNAGSNCPLGSYSTGIDASGNAICETLTIPSETDPKIGTLTTNYIPKWNGTSLTNSLIFDNGTNVGIGNTAPGAKLEIHGIGSTSATDSLLIKNSIGQQTLKVADDRKVYVSGEYGTMDMDGTFLNFNRGYKNYISATNASGLLVFRTGGTTERMVISTDGNVGIGTTAPATKLHVVGGGSAIVRNDTMSFDNDYDLINKGYFDSAIPDIIASATSSIDSFWSGSLTGNITNANSGNVGIGTTNPRSSLDISGSNAILSLGGTAGTSWFHFYNNSGAKKWGFSPDWASGKLSLFDYTKVGAVMQFEENGDISLTPTGNVGIGTTTPQSKLQVFNGSTTDFRVSSNNWTSQILVTDGGGVYWNFGSQSSPSSMFTLSSAGGQNNIYTKNRDFKIRSTAVDEIFVIKQATGNIGIGTTAPATKLHVVGGGSAIVRNDTMSFSNDYDLINLGYLNSVINPITGANSFVQGGNEFGAKAILGTNDAFDLGFETGGVERMTLDQSGNLTVANSLRINGNNQLLFNSYGGGWYMSDTTWIRTYGSKNIYQNVGLMRTDGTLQVGSSGSTFNVVNNGNLSYRTSVLFANTAGDVGIGNTAPATDLHITGNARNSVSSFSNTYDLVNKGYVDSAVDGIQTPSGSTDTFGYWNLSSSGAISNRTAISNSVGINTYGTTGLDNVSFAVAQGQAGSGTVYVSSSNLSKIIGCSSTNFYNTFKVGDTIRPSGQATATITWISSTSEEMLVEPAYTSSFSCTTYNLTSVPVGGAPRFVVKGSGSVGINILDPQASLHISSSATNASSTNAILVSDASSTPAFIVDREGRVTIGSSTSEQLLNIGDGKIFLGSTSTSTEVANLLYNVEGELYWGETLIGSASSNPWRLTEDVIHASSSDWKVAIGSSTTALEALHLAGKMYLEDSAEAPVESLNRLYSIEGKLYWGDSPVGSDATTTWALEGNNLFASSTDWNVGIGIADAGTYKLNVNGNSLFNGTVGISNNTLSSEIVTLDGMSSVALRVANTNGYVGITPLNSSWAHIYTDRSNFIFNHPLYVIGGKLASYATSNLWLSAGGTRRDLDIDNGSGRVAIGGSALNSTTMLDIIGTNTYGVLVNSMKIGELAEPSIDTDAATKYYVDHAIGSSAYLPLGGGTLTGDIAMGGNDITGINEISADKLNVNVIDPLYTINGINYATYGASFAGGLKEEFSGKANISKKRFSGEYEYVIDFDKMPIGGDLWLWRQVVDFSKDNIEMIITPYGSFADTYYIVEDNKIIIRSNIKTEVAYRLTGRRFDWKKWPTISDNQDTKGMVIR